MPPLQTSDNVPFDVPGATRGLRRVNVRRLLSAGYLLLLAAAFVAVVMRPVSFQKSNSIRVVRGSVPSIEGRASFDVQRVLSSIPHHQEPEMVWDVDPDAKYRHTILEGRGNCSNLVFGLARHLELEGVDFQIIHLMKPSHFLAGKGHTVIRTRFRLNGTEHVGIVDIFAGGIPRSGGRFLDVEDLRHAPIDDLDFLSWGGWPKRAMRFYRDSREPIKIGWIPAHEVADYFAFLDRVYVPLGSPRLEKYLYDGLALFLGRYPKINVSDERLLMGVNPLEWPFYVFSLWLFRSAVVLLPLLAWLEWRGRRTKPPGALRTET